MKKINTLFFSLFFFTTVAFAQSVGRQVSSFDKLEVSGAFNVYLQQGDKESARVEASEADMEKIITEMNGDVLKVYQKKGNYDLKNAKVYITYKSLSKIDKAGSGNLQCKGDLGINDFSLKTSGSGNINIEGKLKGDDVDVHVSGSGNADISTVEAKELEFHLAGSGNLTINGGNVNELEAHVAGSGNIEALGLKSEVCEAAISGSGNIKISVNKTLEGSIAGSGDIEYKGNAQVTKSSIIGSGKVRKR